MLVEKKDVLEISCFSTCADALYEHPLWTMKTVYWTFNFICIQPILFNLIIIVDLTFCGHWSIQ